MRRYLESFSCRTSEGPRDSHLAVFSTLDGQRHKLSHKTFTISSSLFSDEEQRPALSLGNTMHIYYTHYTTDSLLSTVIKKNGASKGQWLKEENKSVNLVHDVLHLIESERIKKLWLLTVQQSTTYGQRVHGVNAFKTSGVLSRFTCKLIHATGPNKISILKPKC